jgi:dolichol-phosphate mannosyltransferase
MMELLYKLHTVNAKFTEIPFELRYDYKIGKSKIKLAKTIIDSLFTALYLRLIPPKKP